MTSLQPTSLPLDRNRDILDAFTADRIQPVSITPLYRGGLMLVSLAMVLLPLIYMALIALLGWGVWLHASTNYTVFHTVESGRTAFFLYATPIFVGVVALIFLIKPFFARRPEALEPRSLSRDDEPLLWQLVERIATLVGAPVPSRIDVDTQLNASAGFRRGFRSFGGGDLVLTLGLPLVRGLQTDQLAGVIAHEFGHFAQGAGMRLSYVVRSVNHWFARVVYERDDLDFSLEEAARSNSFMLIKVMLYLSRGLVWLSRRVLWVLMHIGHAISSFMMRQMEFDADRYETALVGADVFATTSREMDYLGAAFSSSMHNLSLSWSGSQRLARSLPELLKAERDDLDPILVSGIEDARRDEKTHWLATHPATRERIESARRYDVRPIFSCPEPASTLFSDFETLAEELSRRQYELDLDQTLRDDQLVDVSLVRSEAGSLLEGIQAVDRMLQGPVAFHWLFPLDLFPLALSDEGDTDDETLRRDLEDIRRQQLEARDAYTAGIEREGALVTRRIHLSLAKELADMKVNFDADTFNAPSTKPAKIQAALATVDGELSALRTSLAGFEALARRRLTTALHLADLRRDATANESLEPSSGASRDRLLDAWRSLAGLHERVDAWHRMAPRIHLFDSVESPTPAMVDRLSQAESDIWSDLVDIETALARHESPFSDGSLVEEVFTQPLERQGLSTMLETAGGVAERFSRLSSLVLGQLALHAQRLEADLGLEPLPGSPIAEST